MSKSYTRLKLACYSGNISMSIVGNLSAVLFLTFRTQYGISYSLLGLLVLINFCTQLGVDLLFSFFSHKFNIPKTVRLMPVLTVVGLLIYALIPMLVPDMAYVGLVIGTVIFSASSGLAEVLISPVIASIPSENPEREMSKLHSIYAWGVVGVVIVSTLFLLAFGSENWYWLAILLTIVPIVCTVLFAGADIPDMATGERVGGASGLLKKPQLWLCVIAIFLGGASEVTMAQWSSSYLEQAMGIPKVWGDVFGVALFAVMLGLARSLYAKFGKHIERVLLLGGIGATACYLTAVVSNIPLLGLAACALTGFCVGMMWPGSLVVASDRFPTGGVVIFAMMAAGGDFGASVAPQLVGTITDAVSASGFAAALAQDWGLTIEQLGMKCGMLIGTLFPLAAIAVFACVLKTKKKT